jgi:subtilisin family serine protease
MSAAAAPWCLSDHTCPERGSLIIELAGPSVWDRYATRSKTAAPMSAQALRTLDAEVRAAQQTAVAAVERAGAQIVSRYTTVYNGLLVHASRQQVSALAAIPGARLHYAPQMRPQLSRSVPFIGADAIREAAGLDGREVNIAIMDTGIDYTHADFGGTGTPAAYALAEAAAESIDDVDPTTGRPLFPTAKVIGGHDFVGPRYDTPANCPPASERAGNCTSMPQPDPDPLDQSGHGTHVAGIAAGMGTSSVYHGVAPQARLIALKIYGVGDEAADIVVDAIEWCVRANIGLPVPGTPARCDVINMSLGESYSPSSQVFDAVVDRAAQAGIVVVAAAGNSSNQPFVVSAPGSSPKILSVASTVPTGQIGSRAVIDLPVGEDVQLSPDDVVYLTWSADPGTSYSGDVVPVGVGCPSDTYINPAAGKIALIDRGVCRFDEKVQRAESEGATGALIAVLAGQRPFAGGGTGGVGIPAWMTTFEARQIISQAHVTGPVGLTLQRVLRPELADTISGFSSRGPSRLGALKPDISAPGTAIFSAAIGSGSGGTSLGGTSMATPHLAGAAALMVQRSRDERLGLGTLDLAALLTNHARPQTFLTSSLVGDQAPIARQGAGRVDVLRAGSATTLVRAGPIGSLFLGFRADTRPVTSTVPLLVRNLAQQAKRHRVWPEVWDADAHPGLSLSVRIPDGAGGAGPAAEYVTLEPGQAKTVWLDYLIDPGRLTPYALRGGTGVVSAAALAAHEVQGYVHVQEVADDGTPVAAGDHARVPFYLLPRAASDVSVAGVLPVASGGPGVGLRLTNRSDYPGGAEVFELAGQDPIEMDLDGMIDLTAVGVRAYEDAQAGETVEFAVATRSLRQIPQQSRFSVYVDTDRDKLPDFVVRDMSSGGAYRSVIQALNDAAQPEGAAVAGPPVDVDFFSRYIGLRVPIQSLGLTAPDWQFEFWVTHQYQLEDWFLPNTDVAPDYALDTPAARYFYARPQSRAVARAEDWLVSLGAHASVNVPVGALGGGDWQPSDLLLVYPHNKPERMVEVISTALPVFRLLLPRLDAGGTSVRR